MLSANIVKENDCEDCYRIVCRGCGWEPSDAEVLLIQKEILTACPDCGWKPDKSTTSTTGTTSITS